LPINRKKRGNRRNADVVIKEISKMGFSQKRRNGNMEKTVTKEETRLGDPRGGR